MMPHAGAIDASIRAAAGDSPLRQSWRVFRRDTVAIVDTRKGAVEIDARRCAKAEGSLGSVGRCAPADPASRPAAHCRVDRSGGDRGAGACRDPGIDADHPAAGHTDAATRAARRRPASR